MSFKMASPDATLLELTKILESDPELVLEQLKEYHFVSSTQTVQLIADACRSRMSFRCIHEVGIDSNL